VRQLLWHRHRLVQMRTRMMNQLHALAMNEGYRWKKKLFSEQGRKPETFNFLGFTHVCGQARKNGKFLVLRRSIRT
jgi:hypothetical protein